MHTPRTLIVLMALFAAGCGTAQPPLTAAPTPALGGGEGPTAAPSETPAPILPAAPLTVLIDDFEAPQTAWQAGAEASFTDSSAVAATLTPDHRSDGLQSLRLDFDANQKPKAIFFLDRELDLSQAPFLQFDLFNPGSAAAVAVAVTTGAEQTWYESMDFPLAAGQQTRAVFDLTAGDYKTAGTNWEFRASIADLNAVHRLAIIIVPVSSGSVWLDALLLTDTPPYR